MSIADIPIKRKDTYRYRGIPEPVQTVESLQQTVEALKEVVETLIGQRGDKKGKAVTYNDIYLDDDST